MVTEAKFDPIGKARARRRLLELIPEPIGQAYDDAARTALISAGVSAENIASPESSQWYGRDRKSRMMSHPHAVARGSCAFSAEA
jgi:hypothetical protein